MGIAMVFIDGSNLYHALKAETGDARLDFNEFGARLASPDELHTIYYYNAPLIESHDPQTYRQQQAFLDRLRETDGVIVRLGRMKSQEGVLVEKGVDVLLAIDMLRHAFQNDYDTAILVSGDGDFAELVCAVTQLGKKVKNASSPKLRSDALAKVSHTFIRLTSDFIEGCRP